MSSAESSSPCMLCAGTSHVLLYVKGDYHLMQCSCCGLVHVGNPPSADHLERIYSFESGYHTRFRDEQVAFETEIQAARHNLRLVEKYKGHGRLLDIGCSAGFFLRAARDKGWETAGVELSNDTADIARTRYGLDVVTGRLTDGTFAPRSFDVITMWDVIEHLENPCETLKMVRKILKDDGILAVTTPNIDGLFPRISFKVARFTGYWPHPEPPAHLFQFSKKTFDRLLATTGFQSLAIRDGRIPLSYSFSELKSLLVSSFKSLLASPKTCLHAVVFIPIALLGPMINRGDAITVLAKKANT